MSSVINSKMSMDEIWEILLEYQENEYKMRNIISKSDLHKDKLKALIDGHDELTEDGFNNVLLGVVEQLSLNILKKEDIPFEMIDLVLENPNSTIEMCDALIDTGNEDIQLHVINYPRFVEAWRWLEYKDSKKVREKAYKALKSLKYDFCKRDYNVFSDD